MFEKSDIALSFIHPCEIDSDRSRVTFNPVVTFSIFYPHYSELEITAYDSWSPRVKE
jgi:hypothetical protein